MSIPRTKLADVLDAVADYIDEREHQKLAEIQAAKGERIEKFARQYEESTGEALPDDKKKKLASLDQETLDHILKVAKNTTESPDALGGPAELSDSPLPTTVKEAAAQADARFLNWINS